MGYVKIWCRPGPSPPLASPPNTTSSLSKVSSIQNYDIPVELSATRTEYYRNMINKIIFKNTIRRAKSAFVII